VPPLAAVGGWFVKHRNTALGVAAAGTGAGTMAVPPIAAALIHHFGWRLTDVSFSVPPPRSSCSAVRSWFGRRLFSASRILRGVL
jgi:MFS family permease